MHIPDGYLGPQTYVPLLAASLVAWTVALRKTRKTLSARYVPYVAMAAAFSFLIQMFNIPIPGGTTGHAVGAAIISMLLGPWIGVLAVSLVLVIQAVLFGDGGITAIGANCFNMAVVMPFVSYWVFRIVRGSSRKGRRLSIAAFASGYVGLCVSAVTTAVQFGIQPLIATGADGRPLYAPYPLSVAVPVMALEHLALFGLVEGFVTMLLFNYFMKNDPAMIVAMKED